MTSASIEYSDLMLSGNSSLHKSRPNESRSAEYQNTHTVKTLRSQRGALADRAKRDLMGIRAAH
jgi:hypothetical protein